MGPVALAQPSKPEPRPADRNITILNLRHGKYLFKSPFPINIVFEDNVYIASSYDLNMFGYGESEDEALRDFCESIIEYYAHLKANHGRLGSLLKRDWDFLSRMIWDN
ncbi:MAG: hypothetical protein QME81_17310 [bacterium]|nr:hypothetical protein [bacterium]